MILSNLSIDANIFNFCQAPEDPLPFFCSPLRLIIAQTVTQYVPSGKDFSRTYYSSLFCIYIFLFIPTCIHFCKLFPILYFISTVHSWDNVSVPPISCGGNFFSVSPTFMVWSRLPRNLWLSPRARLVMLVTAYLWSPDKPLLAVQNSTVPQVH